MHLASTSTPISLAYRSIAVAYLCLTTVGCIKTGIPIIDETAKKVEETALDAANEAGEAFGAILPGAEKDVTVFTRTIMDASKATVSSGLNSVKIFQARSNLKTYSREVAWAAQSSLVVGSAVFLANCKVNKNKNQDCLKNAGVAVPAGLALGAIGGWTLASKQKKYEGTAKSLEAKIEAGNRELAESSSARLAAEKLVVYRVNRLTDLQNQADRNNTQAGLLREELSAAREDESSINKAISRLNTEIVQLESEVNKADLQSAELKQLKVLLDSLRNERALINQQLAALVGSIDLSA